MITCKWIFIDATILGSPFWMVGKHDPFYEGYVSKVWKGIVVSL